MRSLTVKLTLAFLLVGTLGALLVAALVGLRIRSDFNQFLSERDQQVLVEALQSYYSENKTWTGVQDALSSPPLSFYSRDMVLTDVSGSVVIGNQDFEVGQTVAAAELAKGITIDVSDKTVGYVMFDNPSARQRDPNAPPPPEVKFLRNVQEAAIISAVVAALIALALGAFLARSLTRPLRALTAATEAMARGALDQRVEVRSRDEVGELAVSFNQMSSDLARASQLRKQMTADLAHDLRTPLSILRGYTEGLQDSRINGSPKLFALMHGEVEHLQRLVEDLRTLSLADAGELPLARRLVDPTALLERTGLAYIVQAEEQNVTLRVDAEPNLPSINVDTDRMTQVLNNLVSNALRYTSHGEIVLAARAVGDWVQLQVSDTGSGIDAEDLPFVFDRFYRADKSRQRTEEVVSSGLGLAITKAIIEAHKGKIAVESARENGTTFTITLPVANDSASQGTKGPGSLKELVEIR